MKQWVVFFVLCTLVVVNLGLLSVAEYKQAAASAKYKDATEIRQVNDARLSQIHADQVQTLKVVLEIRDKLDRRIGDGPQTGEAPK